MRHLFFGMIAVVLTSCAAPMQYRQVAALSAHGGALAAGLAYPQVREAGLAECVSARVAADVLPDIAVAVLAPAGTSVVLDTDVTWCIEAHDARLVSLFVDDDMRADLSSGISAFLGSIGDIAPDACARRWTSAVADSLASLAPSLLDALGAGDGAASMTWTTPDRCPQ